MQLLVDLKFDKNEQWKQKTGGGGGGRQFCINFSAFVRNVLRHQHVQFATQ